MANPLAAISSRRFNAQMSNRLGLSPAIRSIPGFGVFNLNFLTLSDTHGNAGTFTRAGAANVPLFNGVNKSIPVDTQRVNHGHYVANEAQFSEDLTDNVWHKVRNVAVSKSGDINTITFTAATSDAWVQYDVVYQNLLGTTGDIFRCTLEIKGIAGETVSIARSVDGGVDAVYSHTLSGQWETVSIVPTSPQVLASPTWGALYISRKLASTVTTLQVRKVWNVNVKGMPASYVPPYVPRPTAAAASQWLPDDGSQLSVVNNVVTDSGSSNPLHPSEVINGESTYLDLTDYANNQVVLAGGRRAFGGRYYSTANGGTTAGASPLVDTGVVDWVDEGIYQPGYGQLFEGGIANIVSIDILNVWSHGGTVTSPINATATDPFGTHFMYDVSVPANYDFVANDNNVFNPTVNYVCAVFGLKNSGRIGGRLNAAGSAEQVRVDIDTNNQTISSAGVSGGVFVSAGVESFNAALDIYWWKGSLNTQTSGGIMFVQDANPLQTGAALSHPMCYQGETLQTFIDGIRQNELGNLKFPTNAGWGGANAFPHAAGSLFFSGSPQHDLSQHGNTNNLIVSTVNSVWGTLLIQFWVASVGSGDASNNIAVGQTTLYPRNQAVQYGVQWDDGVLSGTGISHFRVGYRIASTGMAWVWSAYATYDGAFADTGFLQFFANTVGALPWSVLNTIIHNKALTTQEWNNYVIK